MEVIQRIGQYTMRYREDWHRMKITKAAVIAIIKMEIEWCKKHKSGDGEVPAVYDAGFIKGLEQAIYLIEAIKW